MSTLDLLTDFVSRERDRFDVTDSNMFGSAFGKVSGYYRFLMIILKRYDEASEAFIRNTEELQRMIKPGTHPVTPEMAAVQSQGVELTSTLHLEIESFYLFAKILLDNVARTIEYYFGPARGLSLDSHDDLTKNIVAFTNAKGLEVPNARLIGVMGALKRDVSDYRDYQIAHDKSPRTMKGTMWTNGQRRTTRIASSKLYPTERDGQTESTSPHDLIEQIDHYLGETLEWIGRNGTQTRLRRRDDRPVQPATTPAGR